MKAWHFESRRRLRRRMQFQQQMRFRFSSIMKAAAGETGRRPRIRTPTGLEIFTRLPRLTSNLTKLGLDELEDDRVDSTRRRCVWFTHYSCAGGRRSMRIVCFCPEPSTPTAPPVVALSCRCCWCCYWCGVGGVAPSCRHHSPDTCH